MFDSMGVRGSVVEVVGAALEALRSPAADGAALIDRLTVVDRAKAALAAAEAVDMVAFEQLQHREQVEAGVPAARRGRGVADQIGLATKRSPATASRRLATARTLVSEMPATLRVLATGGVSELAVGVAVREAACLHAGDRFVLDAELAAVADTMSVRQVEHAVRRRVIELDTAAVVKRAAKARADRCVSLRPAPDCMAVLSALLPVEQGVAVDAALRRAASTARAAGDARSLAQVKADTLVQRVTGQASAETVPVEIGLVMTSDALLGRTEEPARLAQMGPIPALLARQIACRASDPTTPHDTEPGSAPPDTEQDVEVAARRARAWVRRILTDPVDGTVTSIDTRRRRFSGALAVFLRLRDQHCRDPYCDAPIHDLDHIHDHAHGGPTTAANGQGLCQRGNLVDQIPGWSSTGTGKHRRITTPTGHTYTSRPPPALGASLTDPRNHSRPTRAG